jgi:hypothetical protein
MSKALTRIVSILLIADLIPDPGMANTFQRYSLAAVGVRQQDSTIFEEEAIVAPVIRVLHFILNKADAPHTVCRLTLKSGQFFWHLTLKSGHPSKPRFDVDCEAK